MSLKVVDGLTTHVWCDCDASDNSPNFFYQFKQRLGSIPVHFVLYISLQEKCQRGSCRVSGMTKRPMSFAKWFCLQKFLPTPLECHLHHGTWHHPVETIERSLLYLFFSGNNKTTSGLIVNFFGPQSSWCLFHFQKVEANDHFTIYGTQAVTQGMCRGPSRTKIDLFCPQ